MRGMLVASMFVLGVMLVGAAMERKIPAQFAIEFLEEAVGEQGIDRIRLLCVDALIEHGLVAPPGPPPEPARRNLNDLLKRVLNSRVKRGGIGAPDSPPKFPQEAVRALCIPLVFGPREPEVPEEP